MDKIRGVDLLTDATNTVHLAYWVGDFQTPTSAGRGNVVHRVYDGATWSLPEIIDASGTACCVQMASGPEQDVYLVWEKQAGSQIVPAWSMYENGYWYSSQTLTVRQEANAWYPTVEYLPNDNVIFA